MDGATFTRELNKYKIVRLADHTKIRWKTQRVSYCDNLIREYSSGAILLYRKFCLFHEYLLLISSESPLSIANHFPPTYIIQKSDAKPKLLPAPSAGSTKPIVVGNDDEDFYSMFERINKNILSEKDMKNFIIAMKEVRET